MPPRTLLAALALVAAYVTAAPALADLPAPVEQAFALGKARREPDQRWAFTCSWTSFERMDDEVTVDGETLVARYDPRRPEGEEFQLITPVSEDALTDGQQKMWEEMPSACRSIDNNPTAQDEPRRSRCGQRPVAYGPRSGGRIATRSGPRGEKQAEEPKEPVSAQAATTSDGQRVERIVITGSCGERQEPPTDWDLLQQIIGDIEIVEETEDEKRYEFRLRVPGPQNLLVMPVLRHFRGELTIVGEENRLASLRLHARPFRVPGIARATLMDFTVTYEEIAPGGPITVVRMEQQAAGSAMRHRMENRSTTAFSDFERVWLSQDN